MHTNRLIHETSPYLLQHAHNPVDWHPWSTEAFRKAKSENKPVLLSIGYSACHWCHVMEKESFESEEIAAVMNENFVSIKVDREERPDLDDIYMNAVQMLTGRGGWPMTVFLTPEGKPFFGGTYFPPEDRYGAPGFPRVLRAVAQAYRERPHEVEKSVEQILGVLKRLGSVEESRRSFSPDIIAQSAEKLTEAYDPDHGGLGRAPKFPNVGVYELFLRHWRKSKSPRFLEMVAHTLTSMAEGGIYDHLGGGFHRYSVDEKWLVPHFEKMLYDNAQLLRVYAQAYTITLAALFKRTVEETVAYLLREMRGPEGGFYSTQDADSEGDEGKFFVWTEDEVTRIVGEEAGEIFCRVYDVTELGNFEEKNILHPTLTVEQAAKLFRKEGAQVKTLIAEAKARLFVEREKRVKPFRDEKVLTSWNGLMLSGLAEAGKILAAPDCLGAAEKTVDFIFRRMFKDGLLLHTYKDGKAMLPGYLDDYAFVATGLLDLYEATLERSNLERSIELAGIMIREFWDDIDGGFFYTGKSHEKLISRTKPAFDSSIPSGNSTAAQLLLRLHHYTGEEGFLKRAEKILRLYYDAMEAQPFGFAHMVAALDFYLEKPREIVLVGDKNGAGEQELLRKIHSLYLPNKTIQIVAPGAPAGKLSPLLQGKTQRDGKPTVYVCHNFTCSAPVTEWEELKMLLQS
ncbi:MAG: thioredoxin [Deltaproteobacteria bacterium RIFCSPLOWO2_12_FULL_60_19]|nr:MAG: thioredoxin [Deltaproteobacteria bacterium RIFCSPLOWO2_12_FULL_60_19]